jgi:hypothetical protein
MHLLFEVCWFTFGIEDYDNPSGYVCCSLYKVLFVSISSSAAVY